MRYDQPAGREADRKRVGSHGALLVAAVLCCVWVSSASAKRTTAFKVTNIGGELVLRSITELDDSRRDGDITSRERQEIFQEELNLDVKSYFFHPYFIALDFGGGFLLMQNRQEIQDERATANDEFFNFNGRLSILPKKPYPLTLHYERETHQEARSLALRFPVTNSTYGFTFSLLEPLLPVPLRFRGYHQTVTGEGVEQVVDDSRSHLSVSTLNILESPEHLTFRYQYDREDARSGDPRFIVQDVKSATHRAELRSQLLFGKDDTVKALNHLFYHNEDRVIDRDQFRFISRFDWKRSATLSLFSRYRFTGTMDENRDTLSHVMAAGFNHRRGEKFAADFDLHGDFSDSDGVNYRSYGLGGHLSYRREVPHGFLTLQYGMLYDMTESESSVASLSVTDERFIAAGLEVFELRNDRVIPASVIVRDETRSRTFTEGVDYLLTVVGVRTSIQRILSGDILDGDTVSVDYSFETAGTFAADQYDRSYGARLDFFKALSLSARHHRGSYHNIDGDRTTFINPFDSWRYRAEVRFPLWRVRWSGNCEYEDRNERISSFTRKGCQATAQMPLTRHTNISLSGRRTVQDNETSTENQDLTGVTATLVSRPWRTVRITAEANFERERGRSVDYDDNSLRLFAEWRIRKLVFTADGRYYHTQQGDHERDRFTTELELRREF